VILNHCCAPILHFRMYLLLYGYDWIVVGCYFVARSGAVEPGRGARWLTRTSNYLEGRGHGSRSSSREANG
jgi:hypothetical protein